MSITDRQRTILTLALPLVALAALWANTHLGTRHGTEWDVAVEGYDPRDYLRGHYVAFRFVWPGYEGDDGSDRLATGGKGTGLCLTGRPPRLASVRFVRDRSSAGANCASIVRPIDQPDGGVSLERGVLFMDQRAADKTGRAIADRGGTARIRVRDDGLVTVIGLTPAP